jgi:hypothetical protein
LNRRKRIGNRKKGLLLKWNMIGGYSRRLRRMRVLPPLPPLEEVGKMEEEGGNRGEEDRGRYLTAGLILKVVRLGIPLLYESMMSRSILVGFMIIIRLLEEEGVDEEEGVERGDAEDLLREEEDSMVMRRYSSLRGVEPVKHLRIEHRRPRRPTYMYNKGKLSFLRTDLFSSISLTSFSILFLLLLSSLPFLHSLIHSFIYYILLIIACMQYACDPPSYYTCPSLLPACITYQE